MNKLLSPSDINTGRGDISRHSHAQGVHRFVSCSAWQRVEACLGPLDTSKITHYAQRGKWSTQDLIAWILKYTGPAELTLSSYSCSEEAARALIGLRHSGAVTRLSCFFSSRIFTYTPGPAQYLQRHCDLFATGSNHSKVIVVRNEGFDITAVVSSNLNKNSRREVGVIFPGKDIADYYFTWIMKDIHDNQR